MSLFRELALAKGFSGGGGNPNRVQTITGTLAEPFGDIDKVELYNALKNNAATAYLSMDGTAIAMGTYIAPVVIYNDYGDVAVMLLQPTDYNGGSLGLFVDFSTNVTPSYSFGAIYTSNSESGLAHHTDLYDYQNLIPTTLTIIWHPLPE